MDDHKKRPANQAGEETSVQSWVKANESGSNPVKSGSDPLLQENFLQQITGALRRGTGAVGGPTPKPTAVSKAPTGPIAAGDIPGGRSAPPQGAGDVATLPVIQENRWIPDPTDALPSLSYLPNVGSSPSMESFAAIGAVAGDVAKESASMLSHLRELDQLHPARDSEEVLSKYRRVVYPPSEHGHQTPSPASREVTRTASYPQLPAVSHVVSPLDLAKKQSLFDSITQLDVETSNTDFDPIPPYLAAALHRTAKESRSDARAVVQPQTQTAAKPEYRNARSIRFDTPSLEMSVPVEAQRLSTLYRPIRSSMELTSSLSLQVATSGAYQQAPHSHFMYRPRIPSLRWVKVDDPTYRVSAFTEQLQDIAPWIVGTIFLLAIFLGVFILLSI